MKAVIVDLLNGQAAALCNDGSVIRLPDAGYSLGQQIEVHEQTRVRRKWLRPLASAAAAAVLLLGVGGTAYAVPYGVVSLDVNPAIEYTINCFDYVIAVDGVNEEGRALLADMDRKQLINRPIGDALTVSVEHLEAGDWLEDGEILLAAGARRDAHAEKLLDRLELEVCRGREDLELRAVALSRDEIDAADGSGISAGRRHVLRELSEREDEDFSDDDWAQRPVAELLQELDRREAQPGQGKDREMPQSAEQAGEVRSAPDEEREPGDARQSPAAERPPDDAFPHLPAGSDRNEAELHGTEGQPPSDGNSPGPAPAPGSPPGGDRKH